MPKRLLAVLLIVTTFIGTLFLSLPSSVQAHSKKVSDCYTGQGATYQKWQDSGGNALGGIIEGGGDGCSSFWYRTNAGVYILWTPATGAHIVWGDIAKHYVASFWPYGPNAWMLGFPTSDELSVGNQNAVPSRPGRYNQFQNGYIFWTSSTGAQAVYGAIGASYGSNGPSSCLGYPITDEQEWYVWSGIVFPTAQDLGRVNYFENGGIGWYRSNGQVTSWTNSDYCSISQP